MHISQLRVTYTKEQLANLQAAGLAQATRTIPFPQGENERGGAGATVPVQSLAMTTAVNELVLANLLTTVAQKRARHICLLASDNRDSIFLASRIRDRAPDVQLCTTGSDLLYTHADYNYALQGMVVASCYPTNPSFQGLSSQKSTKALRILFANDSSEGCFNAMLVLLEDIRGKVVDDSEKQHGPVADMLDYGWGNDPGGTWPGIWLSAIGQNGQIIPVHFVSPCAIERELNDSTKLCSDHPPLHDQYLPYVYRKQSAPREAEIGRLQLPNLGMMFFVAIILGAGLFLRKGYAWITKSKWPYAASDGEWLQNRLNSAKQRIDFAIACLACMVLLGWIAEVIAVPLQISPSDWPTFLVLCVITAISTLVVILVLPALVLDTHWQTMEHKKLEIQWSWLERWLERFRIVHLSKQRIDEYRRMIGIAQTAANLPSAASEREGRLLPWAVGCIGLAEFLAVFAVLVLVLWQLWVSINVWFSPDPAPQRMIWFERLIRTPNGLSPLLPVFFLCAAFFAWGLLLVKKLYLVSCFSVPCPFPETCATNESSARNFRDLNSIDRLLRAEIMPPSTWQQHPLVCLVILFVLVLVFLKLGHEAIAPLDGAWFGDLTRWCFFAGAFLLIFTLAQAYFTWSKLRQLLRFVALQPMADAFGRLPDKVVAIFGHYFSSERPRNSHLQIAIHQFDLFRQTWEALPDYRKPAPEDAAGQPVDLPPGVAWKTLAASLATEFPARPDTLRHSFQNIQDAVAEWDFEQNGEILNQNARKCLCVLSHLWPAHSMEEAFGHPPPDGQPTKPGDSFLSLPAGNPFREWAVAAEDFVAVEIIRYISQYFVQLRNLLTSLSLGGLLLLIAAATYPFRPQYLLVLLMTSLAAAVAVFMVGFLVQVNRDELVSRITRTTPNRFTPDLGFLQATGHYVLPIVGGLLLQFSFFTSSLRAMLAPLFHILR
jgi:hypothetical protein